MKNLFLFLFLIATTINVFGQNENALHFDGVNDRVDLPTKIHDSIPGTGTIEAWIKTSNAGSGFRGIVVREHHYGIFLNGNRLMSYNWTGSGNPGASTYLGGAILADNQWHHVALTFQSGVSNGSQLYLDGVPVGSPFTHFENVQAADFKIGTNGLVGQFFQGAIDQVKIYGRVLTPAEINNSYNCIPVSTQKLNAFYNFNQGIAAGTNTGLTSLTDLSGQANNGTSFNLTLTGATSNWVAGYFCQATPCPSPFGLTTQNFCVSATIANLSATGTAIQWYAAASGGTALTPLTPLVSGTTYYASQTVNSCESAIRLAVLVNINPSPAAPIGLTTQLLCVGSIVSNLIATGSSIKWYAAASGGSPLSPSTGITIGNTYYASQTVNGCESAGRFAVTVQACENSLLFDGINDFVQLPQTTLGTNATIEAWIRTSYAGNSFRAIVVSEFQYGLFLNENQLMTYNWSTSGTIGATTYTGAQLNDNQWHHVALTVQVGVVNGTQMYLDGQAVGAPITLFLNSSSSSFRIGCNGNTGNNFRGQIDNAKLWQRTLSPAEINASYNCSAVSNSNLSGSYTFNQGQAGLDNTGITSLSDFSGLNNTGTLNGFTLFNSLSNWVNGFICSASLCPAPFGPSIQYFCNSGTVANLAATGTSIQWYTTPTGGTALSPSTALLTGVNTYYASQTVNSCESAVRYATVVYVTPTPSAPTGSAAQTLCSGTISTIAVTGSNILWYSSASGGTPLITSTALTFGTTYYASQTINTCESTTRLAVTVIECQNALYFDGTYDAVNTSITSLGSAGTLEAWIKTSNAGNGFIGLVVREFHYGLFLNNNQLMIYNWTGSGTVGATTYTGARLDDNQWHHVAMTFQVGVTNGTKMYLDGQPVGSPITLYTTSNPSSFVIGTNGTQPFSQYAGLMDNVKIWSRALSAVEINTTYNCGSPTTTNLLASYNFNRGTAGGTNTGITSLTDNSGNSNNGTLVNFGLNGSSSNWVIGFDCFAQSCPTPTGSASQSFCNSATAANLTATGTAIQWYAAPTGGSALTSGTPLVNGTIYYATQTTGVCESSVRLAVTVTISSPAAPTGSASQTVCSGAIVGDLSATGTAIQWYAAASGGSPLASSTALTNGTTYYASQTVSGCESASRFAVNVVFGIPSAPTGSASQTFCNSATVANLTAAGSAIQWYTASTGGTPLSAGTSLTTGTTYFASQTSGGCESTNRLSVAVTINAPTAPTGSATQSFCNSATVANLTATGSAIQWYTTSTGGTALSAGTSLTDGATYYASQNLNSCEGTSRLEVTVSIVAAATPTGIANQIICGSGTLADLAINGSNITWYDAVSGGNVLTPSTALIDGSTYFASQTISVCESINRLGVTVSVNPIPDAPTGTSQQSFCEGATLDDILVTGTDIEWHLAATGGTVVSGTQPLVNSIYYASQTINGCESSNRLAVDVTINEINSNVTENELVLTAAQTGATYTWLDCNNANQPIPGAIGQSYTVTTNGSYAVEIVVNGCSEISACTLIATVGLNDAKLNLLSVYPNPTNGQLTITSSTPTTATISSAIGTILTTVKLNRETNIDISNYAPGVYFIRTTEGGTLKVIKK